MQDFGCVLPTTPRPLRRVKKDLGSPVWAKVVPSWPPRHPRLLPRRLVDDDPPVGELRARPQKLAEVLRHPLRGLPVALFGALLVLEDAHRDDLFFPSAGDQHEVRDEARHVPDDGHEVLLHPPDHLVDGGRLCLVIAYGREHIRYSLQPRFAGGRLSHRRHMMAPERTRRELRRNTTSTSLIAARRGEAPAGAGSTAFRWA